MQGSLIPDRTTQDLDPVCFTRKFLVCVLPGGFFKVVLIKSRKLMLAIKRDTEGIPAIDEKVTKMVGDIANLEAESDSKCTTCTS